MADAAIIPTRRTFDMGTPLSERNLEAKRRVILAALRERMPKQFANTPLNEKCPNAERQSDIG
jgi:hypothetical protein